MKDLFQKFKPSNSIFYGMNFFTDENFYKNIEPKNLIKVICFNINFLFILEFHYYDGQIMYLYFKK
jgi:hypothetical protein